MKKWTKYLITTVFFGITYTILEYLFSKNIDWKMVIVSTIIYAVIYSIMDLICNKSTTKK